MRSRAILHISKIDEFIKFAESLGYVSEPTKGIYEVFRIRLNKGKPLIGYKRDKTDHVTVYDELFNLARRFLKNSR